MGWEHACMHYCSDGDKDEDGLHMHSQFSHPAPCAVANSTINIRVCTGRRNRVRAGSLQRTDAQAARQLLNLDRLFNFRVNTET
jgi:hypothetical protein